MDRGALRREVLRSAAEGAVYAGTGYGAVWEEMVQMAKEGLLEWVDKAGASYLQTTEKGRAELARLGK